MTILISGIALIFLGLVLTFAGFREVSVERTAWQIVQSPSGEYSFTRWDGSVVEDDYSTEEQARAAMAAQKVWSDEYDAGFPSEKAEREARKKIREERAKTFKPIAKQG